MERYPQAQIVASMGAFRMMVNYFGTDYPERKMVVKDGDVLDLGGHSLTFVGAPNVHWPEVLFSYEATDKVLFSADGFGKFGANDIEDPEGWACEARRYYFGIVGKFGKFVQAVLKKAADLTSRSSARFMVLFLARTWATTSTPITPGRAISPRTRALLLPTRASTAT